MFKFLKDKLKNAVSKFSKNVEEEVESKEIEQRPEEELAEKPEKPKKDLYREEKEEKKEKEKEARKREKERKKGEKERKKEEKRKEKEEGEKRKREEKEKEEELEREKEKEEKEEKKEEEKKEKEEPYVKICPQCGSVNISIPPAGMDLKMTAPDYCQECRNYGTFPEVAESGIADFRKKIEQAPEGVAVRQPAQRYPFVKKAGEEKEEEKEKEEKEKAEKKTGKEEKEETKPKEKRGFFRRLKETVARASISEEKFQDLFWELELALMESNVAVEVIEKIKQDLKKELVESKVSRIGLERTIKNTLTKSMRELFNIEGIDLLKNIREKKEKPYVIVFVGINGVGKTTSLAKLANYLQKNSQSVIIAAADTFRVAAIEQLEEHANRLGAKLIKQDYGSDSAAVCYDAIMHAKSKGNDVVLIDTAGRSHSNVNLMDELRKVVRVSKPDLVLFVGDALTGNDAVEQAKEFQDAVGIDGIVLAKADVDEKGGCAVSISHVTKRPILFMGVGQGYDDLKEFSPDIVIRNLGLAD